MTTQNNNAMDRARTWLGPAFDPQTRKEVQHLMDHDVQALEDAFYRDLEFGTGGLRGIMGVGTNRMNRYTVGMATQGLANYLHKNFEGKDPLKVAIAHDCRHQSDYFTDIAADVLSANGIQVYLFDALRPTPLLSFAVRELGCQAGIVVTASHNPKEYNGYKVYWEDGGQLVPPHDQGVIGEVKGISDVAQICFERNEDLVHVLGEDFDAVYIDALKGLSLNPGLNAAHHDLPIVFTPIHGTTVKLVPQALKAFGFSRVYNVPEQDATHGDFPTVESPNPEEPRAFEMALDRARSVGAQLVMATDPDGDRLGVAVKDLEGNYVLLNGNQTAALLTHYVLDQWKEKHGLKGNEYIVKTIVTTPLLAELAAHHKVDCMDVLTGFKYIAEKMRIFEGEKRFLCGGEESYGFTIGDLVRDKDAVISCCMVAEAAAWALSKDKSLYELLLDIYLQHGLYVESLLSVTRKGMKGAEEINRMMKQLRDHPPASLDGKSMARILDYQKGTDRDLYLNEEQAIDLPRSNVIQFILEDGSMITIRPSGTEPKIKFYFAANGPLDKAENYAQRRREMLAGIERIQKEMGLV